VGAAPTVNRARRFRRTLALPAAAASAAVLLVASGAIALSRVLCGRGVFRSFARFLLAVASLVPARGYAPVRPLRASTLPAGAAPSIRRASFLGVLL